MTLDGAGLDVGQLRAVLRAEFGGEFRAVRDELGKVQAAIEELTVSRLSPSAGRPQDLVDAREVARMLNADLKVVYRWSAAGVLPHRRAGRKLLFCRAEIEEWSKGSAGGPERKRD